MRQLASVVVIGVLVLVAATGFDSTAVPWIAGLLAWILFWSGVLALVRGPRHVAKYSASA
jgi:hypothetical protein